MSRHRPEAVEGIVVPSTAGPRSRQIFGREPSQWVGAITAVLGFLVLFPGITELGLTQEAAVLVTAFLGALGGAYVAWATRDTGLGAVMAVIKTGIPLAAFYGWELTVEQQAGLAVLVPVLVGFYQRTQTAPVDKPVDPSPQQVTASPIGEQSTIPGTSLDEEHAATGAGQSDLFVYDENRPENLGT